MRTVKVVTYRNIYENKNVQVRYNPELNEYRCKLYVEGKYQKDADYFTDDKIDALDTAIMMAETIVVI